MHYLLDPYVVTEAWEACVGDDNFVFLEEDILRVEIFMNDAPCVEVAHCLSHLTADVDALLQGKRLTPHVQVSVEGTPFTEAVVK